MARAVFGINSQTSNPMPSGIGQGTPGGVKPSMPSMGKLGVGDEAYLWFLLLIEVVTMVILRNQTKRHHGG